MKTKKFISTLLALCLCAAPLAGCTDKNKEAEPKKPVTETAEHKYAGGLHRVNVSPTDKDFVKDGKTEYAIVMPDDADQLVNKAGLLVRKHIATATGASLPFVDESAATWSADKKYIAVGCDKLFAAAGMTMPSDYIGDTGYYIKTAESSVFIAANHTRGLVNGAVGFLMAAIGYEMYADDTVMYTVGDSVKLPDCDITDAPDYEYYFSSNLITSDGHTGMRFNDSVFIPVDGEQWHNSFKYLDPDKYAKAHPNWFSQNLHQLCYTAGETGKADGTEGALDDMLDEFMKKMISTVEGNTTTNNITITIQDYDDMCQCEACTALHNKYGTDSAAVIMFCNKVSERLEKYFADKAEGTGKPPRTVNILFFAYFKTTNPPVRQKADGSFEPIDSEVVCRDNVGVYIAPIGASYNKSFYDEANISTADAIKGWGVLSNKLYMWLYETNYSYYLYPLNSYDCMLETYRFCKNNNAIFMFPEGQYNQGNVTAFGKLKEYFNSKALWDLNINYNDLCDDFFAAYFREAAAPMRRYFEELQLRLEYIEENYPEINGGIYNNMSQSRFWPKRLLVQWQGYLDEAYALAEKCKTSDPAFYDTLIEHIDIESIFIRFALITLHAGTYSAETLSTMREEFKSDCTALNITMYSENTSLSSIYLGWN